MEEINSSRIQHPVRIPIPLSVLTSFRHHTFPGLNAFVNEQNIVESPEEIIKLYSKPQISTRKPLPCLVRDQFVPVPGLYNSM